MFYENFQKLCDYFITIGPHENFIPYNTDLK